jgi:hypothetical protein
MFTPKPLALPILLALTTACAGPAGENGLSASCSDVAPLAISGFSDLPDAAYLGFASDPVTIDINATADVDYAFTGFGADIVQMEGNQFTITTRSEQASNYTVVATDGCSVATASFDLKAEAGVAGLNLINMSGFELTSFAEDNDFVGELNATISPFRSAHLPGAWAAEYNVEMSYIPASGGDEQTVTMFDNTSLAPNTNHTVMAYRDGETLSFLHLTGDRPENPVEGDVRLRVSNLLSAGHPFDATLITSGAEVGTGIDRGDTVEFETTVADAGDWLGLDYDADGVVDHRFYIRDFLRRAVPGEIVDVVLSNDHGDNGVWAFVHAAQSGRRMWLQHNLKRISKRGELAEPLVLIGDNAASFDVEIGHCTTVSDVLVPINIMGVADAGGLKMSLTSPNGTTVVLLDENHWGYGGAITGSFGQDDADLDAYTVGDLSDFANENGNGTWTLAASSNGGTALGGVLMDWGIDLSCQ